MCNNIPLIESTRKCPWCDSRFWLRWDISSKLAEPLYGLFAKIDNQSKHYTPLFESDDCLGCVVDECHNCGLTVF